MSETVNTNAVHADLPGLVGASAFAAGTLAQRRSPESTISLFGLNVCDTTIKQAAQWIVERAKSNRQATVSFLNADCVNIMYRNTDYRDALANSDRIFADGIGVRIAARLTGHSLADNVNGTDLFPFLCDKAAADNVGIFLFGAKPGRATASASEMQRRNPGLIISGHHHGYISSPSEEADLIQSINSSNAGILLVALGAPSQELWIARNRLKLRPAVILGVGGLFDYYSGSVQRAPLAVRKLGLEWAWRLAIEPRRLARRYILGNVEFLFRVGIQHVTSLGTIPTR